MSAIMPRNAPLTYHSPQIVCPVRCDESPGTGREIKPGSKLLNCKSPYRKKGDYPGNPDGWYWWSRTH